MDDRNIKDDLLLSVNQSVADRMGMSKREEVMTNARIYIEDLERECASLANQVKDLTARLESQAA